MSQSNFLTDIIDADIAAGTHGGRVVTRFPPEPNGYLHIGHAKSICLNFGIAKQYGGDCHLRFDDTNPTTEDTEYVESIMDDVRWLGFAWSGEVRFASDYFEQMAAWAEELIRKGLAYVDFSSVEALREHRGTAFEPGRPTPYRDSSPEDNLAFFAKMKAGDYAEGECVLRAKIDLSSPNILMRDPLLYRIRHAAHHRTGETWCIYPMYDFAHCLEDAIEGITHSICTLEFENNRELYDWVIDQVSVPSRPRQYEFARLSLPNTVMSKRKLIQLVEEGHVWGWDDPRMPSIAGLRRRGVPPEAIRQFCGMIGVAKANSTVDWGKFDFALRDSLNGIAPRVMAVLDPVPLTLTNVREDVTVDAALWPHDLPGEESRPLRLGAKLWIERADFAEQPPKGWRRLAPGAEVRLRHGWVVRCDEVIKDEAGRVIELRGSADLQTLGKAPEGRRVRGTIHWVNADDAVPATVRLFDRLFTADAPGTTEGLDYREELNPKSLVVVRDAMVEPHVAAAAAGDRFQFERSGYYYRDPADEALVFNRIVPLRDSWAKQKKPPQPRKKVKVSEPAPEPKITEIPDALKPTVDRLVDAGLSGDDGLRLAREAAWLAIYDGAVAAGAAPADAARLLLNDLRALAKNHDGAIGAEQLAGAIALLRGGRVGRADKTALLTRLLTHGGTALAAAEAIGALDRRDEVDLDAIVAQVLAQQPEELARYRGGEKRLFGFFIGAAMRAAAGRVESKALQAALRAALD